MTTATAADLVQRIQQTADARQSKEPRDCTAMLPGDPPARQGDIYIWRIGEISGDATLVEEPSAQLAPGNTRGSRHRIRDLTGVRVYRRTGSNPLQGPEIDAPTGFAVDHGDGADDDHASLIFGPGRYAVTYQRDMAEELRRVMD